MRLCHESIYQAVYQPGSPAAPVRVAAARARRCAPGVITAGLSRRPSSAGPGSRSQCCTIHQRPFDPGDRSEAGHWEGDLIVGKNHGSAIGTLVERQTRMIRLLHLPERDGRPCTLPWPRGWRISRQPLLRSITWDQGTEMARHTDDHRRARNADLLLRLALTLAARLERERQRPAAPVLPQRN